MVHLVISNFNTDPSYLFELSKSLTIYDQSEDEDTRHLLRQIRDNMSVEVHFSKNLGHNLNNILDFIVDNYYQLPEKIAFLKGNIVPRHCNSLFLRESISRGHYAHLWNQPTVSDQENIQYVLQPGNFLEINNSWYVWDSPHRYFTSLDHMLSFLFVDYKHVKFMNFAPGGNYLVEASRILCNPLSLYQGLKEIVGYTWRPAEAFMLERLLPLIFNRTHELKPHCYELGSFLAELEKLPDVSKDTKQRPKENIQNKARWKVIAMLEAQIQKSHS